jgi:hypothetical protein
MLDWLWGDEDWKIDEEKRLAKLRRRQEVFTYVNLCGGGEKYPDKKETSAGLRRGCVGYGNKKTTFQQKEYTSHQKTVKTQIQARGQRRREWGMKERRKTRSKANKRAKKRKTRHTCRGNCCCSFDLVTRSVRKWRRTTRKNKAHSR